MPANFETLRLRHAPVEDPGQSVARFKAFLERVNSPHVLLRADAVIRSVLRDGALFFVENAEDEIVGTTAFYRHGRSPNQWGELGSTAVLPRYRGAKIQRTMYQHITSLMRLSDWPPKPVIAVVDEGAPDSFTSVEHCGFERLRHVPGSLMNATSFKGWGFIETGEQRLYRLSQSGIAEALEFVAANGPEHILTDRAGKPQFWLHVEFSYLRQIGARKALIEIANEIRAGKPVHERIKQFLSPSKAQDE
jgi:hypothetical protein